MTCRRCKKPYPQGAAQCPHCGTAGRRSKGGVFQTSTVRIAAGGADMVYRSVDEVPAPLRSQLLKSTNGANSATILIADRRGRREIARAMRSLPGAMQKKLMQAVLAKESKKRWQLTPPLRIALVVVLLMILGAVVWVVAAHRG